MPDWNETLDDRILRILKDAKECLTATAIKDKLQNEWGGGEAISVKQVTGHLSKLSQVRQDGDKYCLCSEHESLFQDQRNAWAAWRNMKGSDNVDPKELQRRQDNASDASTRLRQHLNSCAKCRKA